MRGTINVRHRKGDDTNRGNGGKIPEVRIRHRVEYHDENGTFATVDCVSTLGKSEIVDDLKRRGLAYHVVNL